MGFRAAVAVGALGIALMAGCGDDGGDGESGGNGEASAPELLSGADDVVLQIQSGGGYVPEIDAMREYPDVVLYGDGRLVTAPDPPGLGTPVAPKLEVRQLDEEQVDDIAASAVEAGLDEPLEDYGMPAITDQATTTFVFETAEEANEASVYGLGSEEDSEGDLTDDQIAAREELGALLEEMRDPESAFGADEAPATEPFEPDAYVVLSQYVESGVPEGPPVSWPLEPERLASREHPEVCTVVEGEGAELLIAAAETAAPDSVWVAGGRRALAAINPAIGLDDECPAES